MSWVKIGEGLSAFHSRSAEARGFLREVKTTKDSLRIFEDGSEAPVLLLHEAGVTAISPILPRASGIICTKGGVSSHLAILSREYQIPCIMAARVSREEELEGMEVMIRLDQRKGFLYLRKG